MADEAKWVPFKFSATRLYWGDRVHWIGTDAGEEIEVTPAMAEAGIQALLFVRNEYGSEAMFDRETIIRVFNAMMSAHRNEAETS